MSMALTVVLVYASVRVTPKLASLRHRSGQVYATGQGRSTPQVRAGLHYRSRQVYTTGQGRSTPQVRAGLHHRSGQVKRTLL